MSGKRLNGRFTWLRYGRPICQAIALLLSFLGYSYLLRNFGMPSWLFLLTVMAVGLFSCGWACAFGTVQEWLRYFGKKVLRVSLTIPPRIDRYLLFSRYVFALLGVISLVAALHARATFMQLVNGRVVETIALVVLGVFLLSSLFIDRAFCKYFCGFGAIYGLASMLRLFAVRRNDDTCFGCGRCDVACQMGVEVSTAHNVRDPNCINCGQCVIACPGPGTLSIGFAPLCKADVAALASKYKSKSGYKLTRGSKETRIIMGEGK